MQKDTLPASKADKPASNKVAAPTTTQKRAEHNSTLTIITHLA
ncbi:hypothetical protein [Acetobacter okinawensis]|nr:hypothetical protein [Acetobacter okinawensis]